MLAGTEAPVMHLENFPNEVYSPTLRLPSQNIANEINFVGDLVNQIAIQSRVAMRPKK